MMTPVERYAALKLLETGLKAALVAAADEADAYQRQIRAKALETDYGTVTLARRKPTIVVTDDAGLIAWCEDELPNLVQRSITAEARTWLLSKRFVIYGEDVIDPATGEAVAFLGIKDGAEYLTFRPTAEAREAAVQAVSGRVLDSLATSLALTEGVQP